jgi:hypothetical protein
MGHNSDWYERFARAICVNGFEAPMLAEALERHAITEDQVWAFYRIVHPTQPWRTDGKLRDAIDTGEIKRPLPDSYWLHEWLKAGATGLGIILAAKHVSLESPWSIRYNEPLSVLVTAGVSAEYLGDALAAGVISHEVIADGWRAGAAIEYLVTA